MAKKVVKKTVAKVPMKTAGKTTTGVVSDYSNYKAPQVEQPRTGKPAPAMKKGRMISKKKYQVGGSQSTNQDTLNNNKLRQMREMQNRPKIEPKQTGAVYPKNKQTRKIVIKGF